MFASSICKLSFGATVQLLVLACKRRESVSEAVKKILLKKLGMHFKMRLCGIKVSHIVAQLHGVVACNCNMNACVCMLKI